MQFKVEHHSKRANLRVSHNILAKLLGDVQRLHATTVLLAGERLGHLRPLFGGTAHVPVRIVMKTNEGRRQHTLCHESAV